jgi:GR25 family glycosyltransferase involved in LPS biosynthesis
MSYLNTAVDKVYVINMDKDTDRLKRFDEQMKRLQISYKRVPGIVGGDVGTHENLSKFCNQFCTAGMKGCALSHRAIWEDMLKNRYENVAIFEDDAVLDPDFNRKFREGWQQLPNDYDVYYLGCDAMCEKSDISSKIYNTILDTHPEHVDQNLNSVSGSIGTHGYILSEKCAKIILDAPIHTHIDSQISMWIHEFNLKAYSISPVIVTVNEIGDSALSETFPLLLNSIFHPIIVFETRPLDWVLGENSIQIGWYSINALIVILSALILLLPFRFTPYVLGWIVLEGLYARDVKNTSKFIQILGGLLLVRYGLRRIML